ncbi:hypothetical protein G5V59_26710 [Nocardioides sp. W3-2-3]|uniref:hypothetical protein n=1 Tax=Nocardioides convexus TaxID=2712224 RepID=UPI0024188B12|nr:hypothetical protein [Nocardioides convexus]NHA01990.1 hypothetical protein [Nocardioides convexus]
MPPVRHRTTTPRSSSRCATAARCPRPSRPARPRRLCQVYFLAPGRTFEHVSFLPYGGLDAITWSGAISAVTPPAKKKPSKKPGKGGRPVLPSNTPSAS